MRWVIKTMQINMKKIFEYRAPNTTEIAARESVFLLARILDGSVTIYFLSFPYFKNKLKMFKFYRSIFIRQFVISHTASNSHTTDVFTPTAGTEIAVKAGDVFGWFVNLSIYDKRNHLCIRTFIYMF